MSSDNDQLYEYLRLEAHFSEHTSQCIGILLCDQVDRLHIRLVDNWWSEATDAFDRELLSELHTELLAKSGEVGAGDFLSWLEDTASHTLRATPRSQIRATTTAAALNHLYNKHCRTTSSFTFKWIWVRCQEALATLRCCFKHEYIRLEFYLPEHTSQCIGILLCDQVDRLHIRLADNWWSEATNAFDRELLSELHTELLARSGEVGAGDFLSWLEDTASHTLRATPRSQIRATTTAAALNHLYNKHCRNTTSSSTFKWIRVQFGFSNAGRLLLPVLLPAMLLAILISDSKLIKRYFSSGTTTQQLSTLAASHRGRSQEESAASILVQPNNVAGQRVTRLAALTADSHRPDQVFGGFSFVSPDPLTNHVGRTAAAYSDDHFPTPVAQILPGFYDQKLTQLRGSEGTERSRAGENSGQQPGDNADPQKPNGPNNPNNPNGPADPSQVNNGLYSSYQPKILYTFPTSPDPGPNAISPAPEPGPLWDMIIASVATMIALLYRRYLSRCVNVHSVDGTNSACTGRQNRPGCAMDVRGFPGAAGEVQADSS